MKNKEKFYKKLAKKILRMPVDRAEFTLNFIKEKHGEFIVDNIVAQFSSILGGAV